MPDRAREGEKIGRKRNSAQSSAPIQEFPGKEGRRLHKKRHPPDLHREKKKQKGPSGQNPSRQARLSLTANSKLELHSRKEGTGPKLARMGKCRPTAQKTRYRTRLRRLGGGGLRGSENPKPKKRTAGGGENTEMGETLSANATDKTSTTTGEKCI